MQDIRDVGYECPGMVEPTIFFQAEPSQIGSKLNSWIRAEPKSSSLILLEPSWAPKLKFDISRAELSLKAHHWYWSSRAISLNFRAIRPSWIKNSIKSAHALGCDTILTSNNDSLPFIYHYFSRHLGWLNLVRKCIFKSTQPSWGLG